MDLWFFLLLLGSGLISVGANNITTEPPTTASTSPRSPTKASTPGPQDGTTPNTSRLNMSTPGTVSTTAPKPPPTTAARISPNATTGSLNISSTLGTTVPVPPAPSLLPSVTPSAPRASVPSTEAETTERNFSMVVTTQETSSASHNDETPIIAVMVALSSLLVIVFIIIVLYMLRFKKYKQAGSHSNSFRLSNGRTDDTEPQSMPLLARSPSTNRKYPPLPVDKLEEEINRRMADDNKLFREEFNVSASAPALGARGAALGVGFRTWFSGPFSKGRAVAGLILNIHFSSFFSFSLQGYQEKNKFIAAQGTFLSIPVALLGAAGLGPSAQRSCAPLTTAQHLAELPWSKGGLAAPQIVPKMIFPFPLQVGDVMNKKPQRLVTQFHFTSWPDFGVPFTPIGMLKFLKKVKTCNPQYAGAIVVHCSAGVGRTGTFIVIDAMLDMMHAERKVDVYGFVSRIRAQRCQMVQTDMQYVFIYQALLEHYLYGDTELENDKMRTGNLPANMKKNRVLQIIPYEFNRVIIPVKRGEENTDYVNASFIDGYRQKDSYIASQGPLQHTIEDFWRMIWEWKSCSIVMLTELEERGQEKCAQYWPSDGSVSYGDITVELKKEEECESYTVRDLLVTNTRENKSRQIRQFHFHGWPEVGIPGDGKGMINIIAAVQKQQQQSGNHPITVHCSAGAGRTGTFCALSTVLERVKAEAILDVFQTVKSLRLQRPHMVQTLEQYEFCYKVVQEYIDAFSDYANFK
ncbi:PTPRA phosphatase, partial [Ptilorrhoa leucosticta]|nr:PTPRA phosphatase [Ptilorrhoa leucosticta]